MAFQLPTHCVKCREPFRTILMMTLFAQFGAKVSPAPMVDCPKGGEHKFYYARDARGRFRVAQ